jgi:hypothetical protein
LAEQYTEPESSVFVPKAIRAWSPTFDAARTCVTKTGDGIYVPEHGTWCASLPNFDGHPLWECKEDRTPRGYGPTVFVLSPNAAAIIGAATYSEKLTRHAWFKATEDMLAFDTESGGTEGSWTTRKYYRVIDDNLVEMFSHVVDAFSRRDIMIQPDDCDNDYEGAKVSAQFEKACRRYFGKPKKLEDAIFLRTHCAIRPEKQEGTTIRLIEKCEQLFADDGLRPSTRFSATERTFVLAAGGRKLELTQLKATGGCRTDAECLERKRR